MSWFEKHKQGLFLISVCFLAFCWADWHKFSVCDPGDSVRFLLAVPCWPLPLICLIHRINTLKQHPAATFAVQRFISSLLNISFPALIETQMLNKRGNKLEKKCSVIHFTTRFRFYTMNFIYFWSGCTSTSSKYIKTREVLQSDSQGWHEIATVELHWVLPLWYFQSHMNKLCLFFLLGTLLLHSWSYATPSSLYLASEGSHLRCSINDAGPWMTHVDTKAVERFSTATATWAYTVPIMLATWLSHGLDHTYDVCTSP